MSGQPPNFAPGIRIMQRKLDGLKWAVGLGVAALPHGAAMLTY